MDSADQEENGSKHMELANPALENRVQTVQGLCSAKEMKYGVQSVVRELVQIPLLCYYSASDQARYIAVKMFICYVQTGPRKS